MAITEPTPNTNAPTAKVIDHGAIANYKKVKPIDIKELEVKRSRQQTDSIWEIKLYSGKQLSHFQHQC
ncbi:MAG: hypothetical protein HC773_23690 [Scytonema sp. CRU_2_7]|nr:hypothetical protein [Scytonema sp. CRU_2_7]